MEWDAKWGLEKLAMFGSKTCESPKKIQLADWRFVDAAELETGSFDLSGGTGIRSASSGNGVYGSSAKSSVSASTDPSLKDGMNSPPPDIEPFIGLKLGKRTYFERNRGGNNVKSSLMAKIPMSSTPSAKKTKSSSQCTPTPYCQVEGCNLDLSSAKDYHRKHRVCDSHSKCPKVIVGGVERRFCQQCSRFHSLSEFDEKKRSCRRRLSDHNARRRKPLQDPTQFSLMNGRQQMNFVNQCTQFPSRTAADSTWDSTCTSKFTITRGSTSKPEKAGNTSKLQYMAGIQLPNAISPSKGTIAEVFNQGAEQSLFNSNGGTAQEVPCALSLLSSTFWGSYQPELISFDNPLPANQSSSLEPLMHATPQVLFVSSPDYLQAEHHSTDFNGHNLGVNATSGDHLSLAQLFKVPHDTDFYFNALN